MIIKRRSPNYPSIDLQEAVNVVATLFQGIDSGPRSWEGRIYSAGRSRCMGLR